MSSITGIVSRRAAMAPRALVAAHVHAPVATRAFTTTPVTQKTPTESVKDGLKKVDRAVSDKIVTGIDAATGAAHKIKGEAEHVSGEAGGKAEELKGAAKGMASEAKGKAEHMSGDAGGKAEELKGAAKGMASEAKGKAESLASEAKSKAEGTASEVEGKTKGAASEAEGKAKSAAEKAKQKL